MKAPNRLGPSIALSSALLLASNALTASAQSTYTGPEWSDLANKLPLSSSYDSLQRVWANKDQGGRFGGTLLVLEAAILDYYAPGVGTAIQQKVIDYLYPKSDPFQAGVQTILNGIAQSEQRVRDDLEEVWNRVHEDHNEMAFATFETASDELGSFFNLQPHQRVDAANRVKLSSAVRDLTTFINWIEQQDQPGDVIGNLHRYVMAVRLLVEAKAEEETLARIAPAYDMFHAPGQGYNDWLASLSSAEREALTQDAASGAQAEVTQFLDGVFDYLIGGSDAIKDSLVVLRDERFVLQGNEPGYLTWWYRLDSDDEEPCWESQDDSCFYMRDTGSFGAGSFSHYMTRSAEDIYELHKWFEYNSMLMTVWAPVRVALDQLWSIGGRGEYRSMTVLDQDMDAYLYAESGFEDRLLGDDIPRDALADALDYLYTFTSSTHRDEWSVIEGCGISKGAEHVFLATEARYVTADYPNTMTGKEWLDVVCNTDNWNEQQEWFINRSYRADPLASREVFDAAAYLALYGDLQAAFGSDQTAALRHWLDYGINEGRVGAPWFDPGYYLYRHADVANAYGAGNYAGAVEHFVQFGADEGRASSPAFDAAFYLSSWPDLVNAFGWDYRRALQHFREFGIRERRVSSPVFDLGHYLAAHGDLEHVFGAEPIGAADHYLSFGTSEGRVSSSVFDVRYYLSQYADLQNAFGNNYAAARNHFLHFGLQEGRRGSPSFDVAAYVARYPDLQAAFGTNYHAAMAHWFAWGRHEGRNAAP
jgi:hypothetical protein